MEIPFRFYMAFSYFVAAAAAILGVVECTVNDFGAMRGAKTVVKRQHTDHGPRPQIKLPDWNYANATTKDATADGSVGVILEDDIVEGKPGKDGATVKKSI
jgi:hypothetical protein